MLNMPMLRTRIYFIETSAAEHRSLLCRWVEQCHESGRKVQVLAESGMAARHLDQMLWTFSESSFVPHGIHVPGEEDASVHQVLITVGEVPLGPMDVLVCDAGCSLDFMARFDCVLHFVVKDDPGRRQDSRLMWQKAKDRGFEVLHVPESRNAKMPSRL